MEFARPELCGYLAANMVNLYDSPVRGTDPPRFLGIDLLACCAGRMVGLNSWFPMRHSENPANG